MDTPPPPDHAAAPMNLRYAPAKRDDRRWMVVIAAGIGTTALALGISWFMEYESKGDFTIMGLYGYGILPVGAFLVGLAAASGYALAAKLAGIRIRHALLWTVAGLMVLSYFAMHYIEFKASGPLIVRATGQPAGFFTYYDATTRSMQFKSRYNRQEPDPLPSGRRQTEEDDSLGALGYGLRLLEVIGFVGGGLVLPAALRGKRYCDLCERYYTTLSLGFLPASMPLKKTLGIFQKGKVALDGEHQVVADQTLKTVEQLVDLLNSGDVDGVRRKLEEFEPGSKAAKSLRRRVELIMSRCEQCGDGVFHPQMQTQVDSSVAKQELYTIPLPPEIADAIRPRKHATVTETPV